MTVEEINVAILSSMYEKNGAVKVINNIEEHHLLEHNRILYRTIVSFFKKYGKTPTLNEIFYSDFKDNKEINLDWAINEVKSLHKKELLKEAIKNGAINLSKNNVQKAVDDIYKVMAKVSLDDEDVIVCDSKKNFLELYGESVKSKRNGQSIMTGLKSFDEFTGGIGSEDLCFILGEPEVGKSFLMSYMAYNAVKAKKNVLYFNLDMGLDLTMSNFLTFETKVDRLNIYNGNFTPEEKKAVLEGIKRFNSDDSMGKLQIINSSFNVDKLYNYIMSNIVLDSVDIIFIDQLSNIGADGKDYIVQALNSVRSLHRIVKKIRKPIVVASQLNREFSKDKQNGSDSPQRHHFGFTDAIQQAADSVFTLYRDSNDIMTFQIYKFRKKEHKKNKFKYEWHPPEIVEIKDEWYSQEIEDVEDFNFDD